jgi:mRNA interferase HigB
LGIVYSDEEATSVMNVISFRRIREFTLAHRDAGSALNAWYTTVKKSRWHNLAELKQVYPTADLVARYTVFNIKGNKYRVITRIVYRSQTVFIIAVMTHAEYDLGIWKE